MSSKEGTYHPCIALIVCEILKCLLRQVFLPNTGDKGCHCKHAFGDPGKCPAYVHALHSVDWNENVAEYDTRYCAGGSQQHQKLHGGSASVEGMEQVVYYVKCNEW